MENDYQQPSSLPPLQQPLPNATAVLVLGIVSIVGCFCWGIIGLACGITAIILGNKAIKEYNANAELYTPGSYSNVKAGRICAIIGVVLSSLYVVLLIIYIILFGTIILSNPNIFHHHSDFSF
jgi:hypothetical protein